MENSKSPWESNLAQSEYVAIPGFLCNDAPQTIFKWPALEVPDAPMNTKNWLEIKSIKMLHKPYDGERP